MVPHETEGRQGKDETGRAKSREAKLGAVFTQVNVDVEGRPIRDEGSTTYVGAIETAEEFGQRIFTEAIRRGARFAEQMIVLGDGAPWIWNLAAEHFPGAIEIVDLYHAREHLTGIAKIIYGPGSPEPKQWQMRASRNWTQATSKPSSPKWRGSDRITMPSRMSSAGLSGIFRPRGTHAVQPVPPSGPLCRIWRH